MTRRQRARKRAAYHNLPLPHLHRAAVHEAQRNRCAYCAERFDRDRPATVDHVWPKSRRWGEGWRSGLGNVLLADADCNNAKGDREPYPCELILLLAVNLDLARRGWLPDEAVAPPAVHGLHSGRDWPRFVRGPRNTEGAP